MSFSIVRLRTNLASFSRKTKRNSEIKLNEKNMTTVTDELTETNELLIRRFITDELTSFSSQIFEFHHFSGLDLNFTPENIHNIKAKTLQLIAMSRTLFIHIFYSIMFKKGERI